MLKIAFSLAHSHATGMKLARRILTGSWSSTLSILSRGVGGTTDEDIRAQSRKDVVGKLKSNLESLATKRSGAWDEKTLVAALEGLQRVARLCNILGLLGVFFFNIQYPNTVTWLRS